MAKGENIERLRDKWIDLLAGVFPDRHPSFEEKRGEILNHITQKMMTIEAQLEKIEKGLHV